MANPKPWATCGSCRYFESDGIDTGGGDCMANPPRILDEMYIACRHYVERYTLPPKDEEATRG